MSDAQEHARNAVVNAINAIDRYHPIAPTDPNGLAIRDLGYAIAALGRSNEALSQEIGQLKRLIANLPRSR